MCQIHPASGETNNYEDIYDLSLSELVQLEVTIATGSSVPLKRAPAIASVITASEIEAMGARTLNEVLESVPGLHVSASTLNRLDPIFSIRGIHTPANTQVLILVNGKPISGATTGTRPGHFRVPAENISRVEVIRGPGSAVYGADAYSGVINVITKDYSAMDGSEIGGRGGSFDTHDVWGQTGFKIGDWTTAFSFAYQTSNGDTDRVVDGDLQSNLDAGFGTSASLAPGPLTTAYEVYDTHLRVQNKNWDFDLWSWKSESSLGAGAAQALDPKGGDSGELYSANITYNTQDWFKNWDVSLIGRYYYYDNQAQLNLLPPGSVVLIGADGNLFTSPTAGVAAFSDGVIGNPGGTRKDYELGFVTLFTGFEGHRIRIAAGGIHQSVETKETKNFGPGVLDEAVPPVVDGTLTDVTDTDDVFLPDSSRDNNYFSIQDEWQFFEKWNLVTGVRYDNYSDFGSTTNPRIALVWEATQRFTTKVLYGSAYRAPNFGEQGFENNPVNIGNPNLNPETIDTLEFSFSLQPIDQLQTSINIFSYSAEDLIETVPADESLGETPNTQINKNARDQDGYGYEWELDWQISQSIRLKSNYAWQNSQDKETDDNIPDAPGKQFTTIIHWQALSNFSINTRVNWVKDRLRTNGDTREDIDDYTVLDITGRYKNLIIDGLDISLALRNALDEDVREPSSATSPITNDYPMEGSSAWLELRYNLK